FAEHRGNEPGRITLRPNQHAGTSTEHFKRKIDVGIGRRVIGNNASFRIAHDADDFQPGILEIVPSYPDSLAYGILVRPEPPDEPFVDDDGSIRFRGCQCPSITKRDSHCLKEIRRYEMNIGPRRGGGVPK